MIDKLVRRAIRCGAIQEEEYEVYRYSYTLLISWILSVVLILVISGVFGQFAGYLVFLAGYIPLRQLVGGVHVEKMSHCFIVTLLVESVLMIPILLGLGEIAAVVGFGLSVPSLVAIYLLSPQESLNKPLDAKTRERCKKQGRRLAVAEVVIAMAFVILGAYAFAYYLSAAIVLSAINLLLGLLHE
jgi:Membrane protein putatively involved in post-translational modification of the autoinducing quorum-sensing peptide